MIVGDDTALQVTREIMIPSIAAATAEDAELLAHLMLKVGDIARAEGIEEGGYRTVMNTGEDGGQTVHHLHFHLLGGKLGPILVEEGLVGESDGGLYNTVDGVTADWNVDQSYWAIFIGEEYATTGIDQIVIADEDTFSLVYTIG